MLKKKVIGKVVTTSEHKQDLMPWEIFCRRRGEYFSALAEVVEQGMKRRDTTHPTFCGCIDWHSSVHGTYALLVASRMTNDDRWLEFVDSLLTPERLHGELLCLHRGELDHELPYGFAWFLKLAQERERWGGKLDLSPLAEEIAVRLEQWIFSLTDEEVLHHTLRREYGNLSWAVLNLWEWSQWKGDSKTCQQLANFTKMRLAKLDTQLPISYDECIDEFFAASLQRTRAILTVLDLEDSLEWCTSYYRNMIVLNPLHTAPRPHSGGLNFSRAWGFWTLFQKTGDERYRDMYVKHIVTHMESPEYWRDDYKKYSHWVPQFGVYAIALSLEETDEEKYI